MKVEAIIVGGGKGRRFGNDLPKQFCLISGHPILDWTLRKFEMSPSVTGIILVVPRGMRREAEHMLCLSDYRKVRVVTEGGEERMDSVYEGLKFVEEDTQIILVHDGVRPFVSRSLIEEVVKKTEIYGAVVPGVPVKETIKEGDDNALVTQTVPRDGIYLIQTPQGFKNEIIRAAHEKARIHNVRANDDAGLVEKAGSPVKIIPGEEVNIKITTFFDFKLAKVLLDTEEDK